MNWFRKKCPLEQWMSDDLRNRSDKCQPCDFYIGNKCCHKQIISEHDEQNIRGYPALVKHSTMNKPRDIRAQFERAAINYAGFNSREEEEYWSVSQAYDAFWDEASPNQRQGILQCISSWRNYLEAGYSPLEANDKVKEWLNSNAEDS